MLSPSDFMTMQSHRSTPPGKLAIFVRLLERARGKLTPPLARYLLTLSFGEKDQARMCDLASRNQEGALSAAEQVELNNYVRAGHLLAVLQSKARVAVRK
jgi:hypothetical protein